MSVGKSVWPSMYSIAGLTMSVSQAGVKYSDRDDLLVFSLCEGASVAGVFTKNAFAAAPVIVAKKYVLTHEIKALLINSGNANACTGEQGIIDAEQSCAALAALLGVGPHSVLPFSTGVIGERLNANKIIDVLPSAVNGLVNDIWLDAAKAIMTTDTRPKGASCRVKIGSEYVHITGICKGAGMIRPNMGTMLAYVATDACIDKKTLHKLTQVAADKSFNRITIDGDTSTNDACVVIATGQSNAAAIDTACEYYEPFLGALVDIFESLAKQIVCDGEGATKCVHVNVEGGKSHQECLDVAYAIAHSPLVKTAWFASDANWGRIVCAIGYADVKDLNPADVSVWLNDVQIVKSGERAPEYTDAAGQAVLSLEEFTVRVSLGRGEARESLWTSDLSHEYVRINAEYRS